MRPRLRSVFLLSGILLSAGDVRAELVTHPDQVCAPAADPCVIARPVEVSFEHRLDFGNRVVRVEGEGHLLGTLDLHSGGFETDVDGNWMDVAPQEAYQRVEILTQRACSLDSSVPCSANAQCRSADAGTCSAGDGGIRLRGTFSGVSPIVTLQAVGDVVVRGAMRTAGNSSVPDANTLAISSVRGDVRLGARIEASAGVDGTTGDVGRAGAVIVHAGGDIFVTRRIRAVGRWGGVSLSPKGDATVRASLLLHGGRSGAAPGGLFSVDGRGSFTLQRRAGAKGIRIDLNGGYRPTGESIDGGTGGHGEVSVSDAIHIDPKARLTADGWHDDHPWYGGPGGGVWSFSAEYGMDIANTIHARGLGESAVGGNVGLTAPAASFGSKASILVTGSVGGTFSTYVSAGGALVFDGLVDARGSDGPAGRGGTVQLTARNEVLVNGSILNGGGSHGGAVSIEACRLELGANARIDGSYHAQAALPGRNDFTIHGSVTALQGSEVRGAPSSVNEIVYRLVGEPPVLLGTMEPAPTLVLEPSLYPCVN